MSRLARVLTAVCALTSFGVYGTSGLAQALEIPLPRLEMSLSLDVVPKKLSRGEATPIALGIDGRVWTVDGSRPQPLRKMTIELDKQIAIDARGLPPCQGGRDIRFPDLIPDLKSRCKGAIVGAGKVGFQIEFPGQAVTSTESKLVVVNGSDRSSMGTNLYAVAYLTQPIVTAFVMTISIRRESDGNRLIIDVPKLANDAGSLTRLSLKLNKRFTRSGKTVDLLTGRCSRGTIRSKAQALFADRTIMQGETLQTCVPRRD